MLLNEPTFEILGFGSEAVRVRGTIDFEFGCGGRHNLNLIVSLSFRFRKT